MEPLGRAARAELLVELGEAHMHAGVSDATERLREAFTLQDDPRTRAEICLAMGQALFSRGEFEAARDAFRRGFEQVPDDTDDLLLELRAWYVTDARHDLPLPAAPPRG
ncbi:MAG: tetratricopeptide repeat protein [Solirubrobacteraceae bacterium]